MSVLHTERAGSVTSVTHHNNAGLRSGHSRESHKLLPKGASVRIRHPQPSKAE